MKTIKLMMVMLFTLVTTSVSFSQVELITFKAELIKNGSVQLDWATASEKNNEYFTVEKSKGGQYWEFVAEVDGAGKSQDTIAYQAFDKRPFNGLSYYRLKQTDFDGEYTYSDIKSVQINSDANITVRPNPTNGVVTVAGAAEELRTMTLTNASGKHIQTITKDILHGPAEVKINLSTLSPGVYFINTVTQIIVVVKI